MNKKIFLYAFLFLVTAFTGRGQIPGNLEPSKYFGFQPGTDRELIDYNQLIAYFSKLDEQSPLMKMEEIGVSPLGKKMYVVFISSEKNIQHLDQLGKINRKLALEANLSEQERNQLISEGKVFVLATLSMHSEEVGPSQAAPIIAWDLVNLKKPGMKEWLDQVVFMMVPCHNPDGMQMVVENYRKYKGTKYEGCSLPGVYHKYVGHDNNRDFISLSQEDTRAINQLYSKKWFPQVMIEKHQMGATDVRYFAPPPHDPIAENVNEAIWNWMRVFGSAMAKDMTAAGLAGVTQEYLFDDYWPGSTETAIWKNMIGMLTECASANVASPVWIEKNELQVDGKGLGDYKKSINMPLPWPGGWWRLGDIVQYEIESTWSLLRTAAVYHADILRLRNDLCRKEVANGRSMSPAYYILPAGQPDQSELVNLVNLLDEHGIDVYELASDVKINNLLFHKGDIAIPLAQPFRPFIKEVMEKQAFPERHYTPGGEMIQPYDITSWSLPLHRSLKCTEIPKTDALLDASLRKVSIPYTLRISKSVPSGKNTVLLSAANNGSFSAAFSALTGGLKVERTGTAVTMGENVYPSGSFVISAGKETYDALNKLVQSLTFEPVFTDRKNLPSLQPVRLPSVALVESWFHDMDAGWTRFLLDQYHIPYEVIRPSDLADPKKEIKADILIFPDQNKSILMEGKYRGGSDSYMTADYPPEYAKGMGKNGLEKVLRFMNKGGRIVAWGRSVSLFEGMLEINENDTVSDKTVKEEKEEFVLPFRDISENLSRSGLVCPGSLMKVNFLPDHPLTYGMPASAGVFYRGRPAFRTFVPGFDMDRRVIGSFPEKDILMSGYCNKEELLSELPTAVLITKGKGQLVLFSFSPVFRASMQGNYKLLFNAILM